MMMGHGSPSGLFSVGQFPESGLYIVDHMMAAKLKRKKNSVFIWCYAAQFVNYHKLNGWYSDMFVSEFLESVFVGLEGVEPSHIEQSNESFSEIAGKYINLSCPGEICKNVKREYSFIARENPCARYNLERLAYSIHKLKPSEI